jgi:hypothetical protein
MIASWKTKKIKKHKRRFLIGLFISLSIILVVFIVLISLYACNVL